MTSNITSKIEELIGRREIARKNGDGSLVMNLKDDIAVAVNEREREEFLAQIKQAD
jgi:hypothetical protein